MILCMSLTSSQERIGTALNGMKSTITSMSSSKTSLILLKILRMGLLNYLLNLMIKNNELLKKISLN